MRTHKTTHVLQYSKNRHLCLSTKWQLTSHVSQWNSLKAYHNTNWYELLCIPHNWISKHYRSCIYLYLLSIFYWNFSLRPLFVACRFNSHHLPASKQQVTLISTLCHYSCNARVWYNLSMWIIRLDFISSNFMGCLTTWYIGVNLQFRLLV